MSEADVRVWRSDPCEFTIKSAYKLLHEGSFSPSHTDLATRDMYRKIWQLQIPLKIKLTMWRAVWNYLPTQVNLWYRRIRGDSLYSRCGGESESLHHVF